MNIEDARKVLSSCHPADLQSDDPLIRQAVAMAREHPELQNLIRRQQVLDDQISSALKEEPIPDDLKARLLGSVGSAGRNRPKKVVRWSWAFGIAAMLMIGFGTVFLHYHEDVVRDLQRTISGKDQDAFDTYREGMAYYISSIYFQLDHLTDSLPSIEAWLREKETPAYDDLPEALVALNPIGCKELDWKGNKVSLVCFHSREGKIVHLFIMESPEAPDVYQDITTVAYSHGLETGGWTSGNKVYLLVGSESDVDIEFALG